MSRYPHAALVLIKQAEAHDASTKYEAASAPDGLGVVRSVKFSKRVSHWLTPLLVELNDPRIIKIDYKDQGLTVTFTPRTLADSRMPFPLLDAETIVRARESQAMVGTHRVDEDDDPLPVEESS